MDVGQDGRNVESRAITDQLVSAIQMDQCYPLLPRANHSTDGKGEPGLASMKTLRKGKDEGCVFLEQALEDIHEKISVARMSLGKTKLAWRSDVIQHVMLHEI